MPRMSRNATLQQWGRLLRAVRKHQARLGGVAPFRAALEKAYVETVASRVAQMAKRAAAKQATRRLGVNFDAANDAAICLRNFIKSLLGPRSESLREFGMTPRRRRRQAGEDAGAPGKTAKKPAVGFEPPR